METNPFETIQEFITWLDLNPTATLYILTTLSILELPATSFKYCFKREDVWKVVLANVDFDLSVIYTDADTAFTNRTWQ